MYKDRRHAGRVLGKALMGWKEAAPLVLALPRGGVPVGFEVAQALGAPLEILPARKLRAPGQPEIAIGAVAGDPAPALVWESDRLDLLPVAPVYLKNEIAIQKALLKEMGRKFAAAGRPAPRGGRPLIVVDDGVATGSTARAAVEYLRRTGAGPLVLALPVGPADTLNKLRPLVKELVCPLVPGDFQAVGQYYKDFSQVTDEGVLRFLAESVGKEFVPIPNR